VQDNHDITQTKTMIENGLERTLQLSKARKLLTAFVVLIVMPLLIFVLLPIGATDETRTITASPTPMLTPTSSPELVTVEYQIEVVSEISPIMVEVWYTSKSNGENQTDTVRVNNSKPFTKTVTIHSGEHVEIAGVLANSSGGKLVCRILVDHVLVEKNTGQGAGASVYCSGFVFTQQ